MTAIARDSLPPPHQVDTEDESVVLVTPSSRVPRHYVADPQLQPRLFVATWRAVPASVALAIRRHFEQHFDGPFRLTIPRTGEVVDVVWRSHPSITWASAAFATNVTAELEQTLTANF